ncbi:MAG: hypothetical protein GXP17_08060 [Gammaproteobacteria bacterium]|nr:hypothetical protein [Gammaproteobacteria bacterium]
MLAIQINLKKNSYHLGEPILLSVIYRNAGSSSVSREDPSQSFNAEIHVIDRNTKEDFYYTMGKLEVTQFGEASDEYALVEPVPDNIDIDAKGEYTFETDLNQRLFLGPGVFDCEFRDAALVSNKNTIAIWYTQDSVSLLLNLVMDSSLDYSRREWAADWLRELLPDFKVTLPPDSARTPNGVQDDSANQGEYQIFKTWWLANRDTDEVKKTLDELNDAINSGESGQ